MNSGHKHCRLIHVSGRVQGVGFRAATAEQARRLGLAGHAANLSDGRVEVLLYGSPEAVAAMADWLEDGPPLAHVRDIAVRDVEPDTLTLPDGFHIR